MILTCGVTGDDISGYWERVNADPIPDKNNRSSLNNNNKKMLKITISKAHPNHSGKYRCVAYSQWGVAQSNNVTVTITSKSNNVLM